MRHGVTHDVKRRQRVRGPRDRASKVTNCGADGVGKLEGSSNRAIRVRRGCPIGVQERGMCTEGFSRNLGDLGLSYALFRGGHPVTNDQATRRLELHPRAERTKQFSMGTIVRVHRGRLEEGRGVGVRCSTGEAGEVTPGDPVEGRADQQHRANGGTDGRNFESEYRLNETSSDSDTGYGTYRA